MKNPPKDIFDESSNSLFSMLIKSFEKTENPVDKSLSSGLEKFKVDVTKEN